VDLERGPLSIVNTIEELLERKIGAPGLKNGGYYRRGSADVYATPFYLQKVGTNFADKRRSLSFYSSLENSGRGV
jgi:hypothetical protein